MRPLAALLVLALPACAVFGRGRSNFTDTTVPTSAATTIKIARTQLEHHGYTIASEAENLLVTNPKPLQQYPRDTSGAAAKGDRWFLRVEVQSASFTAGSRMTVQGFVVPKVAKASSGGAQQVDAILVTDRDGDLWNDVRAAARWIVDEANRQGPRQSGGERP